MDLVNNEAAILVEEKDLNGDILVRKIEELLKDSEKYKNNLSTLSINDSALKIYNCIKELVDRK